MAEPEKSWGTNDAKIYAAMRHGPDGKQFLDSYIHKFLSRKNVIGKDAVDIGCGAGAWTQYLLDQGARHVYGFDLNPAMVQKAQEALEKSHPDYQMKYSIGQADAAQTQFRDAMFDVLLSANVGCNLSNEAFQQHFDEAHRIARPGARFVVTAPNSLNVPFTTGVDPVDIQEFIDTQWENIQDPQLRTAKRVIEGIRNVLRATFVLDPEGKPILVTEENASSVVKSHDPIKRFIPGPLAVDNVYHTAAEYFDAAKKAGWRILKDPKQVSFKSEKERQGYNEHHGPEAQLGPEYVGNPAFLVAEFRKAA